MKDFSKKGIQNIKNNDNIGPNTKKEGFQPSFIRIHYLKYSSMVTFLLYMSVAVSTPTYL